MPDLRLRDRLGEWRPARLAASYSRGRSLLPHLQPRPAASQLLYTSILRLAWHDM